MEASKAMKDNKVAKIFDVYKDSRKKQFNLTDATARTIVKWIPHPQILVNL